MIFNLDKPEECNECGAYSILLEEHTHAHACMSANGWICLECSEFFPAEIDLSDFDLEYYQVLFGQIKPANVHLTLLEKQ